MYDIAIIGTGMAGVSAALTLHAMGKNFIWFGTVQLSEKIRRAECIRNYPGLPSVSGESFADILRGQIGDLGITVADKRITNILPSGEHYVLLSGDEMFEARAVILASGVDAVRPIVGETEFVGKGVSYCAVCDGFLYKGRNIAVIASSREFEHEVEFLAELAAKVYFVPLYPDCQIHRENVEMIEGMPRAILGNSVAEKLHFDDKDIQVDGIFMLKSAALPDVLLSGLKMNGEHVSVDREQRTNLRGVFAAGDCTGRPYQYAKAAGEGNVAAHSAVEYLNKYVSSKQ